MCRGREMTKTTCDKCGREIDPSQEPIVLIQESFTNIHADLCAACCEKLSEIINQFLGKRNEPQTIS